MCIRPSADIVLSLCLILTSCANVPDLPLPAKPDLAASIADLRHDHIDPATPLTVSQVASLAVRNNPDLQAARAQHRVAQAQVLQAGLLPNPQITGAILPLVAGPASITAWNAGISEDIRALITTSSSTEAARSSANQVDTQILWQEWQVIGQARLLAVDIIEVDRLLTLLARNRALLSARYDKSRRAVAAGDETLSVSTPDLAALQTIITQMDDLQRQQSTRRHQLNALLGLTPRTVVLLNTSPDIPSWDRAAVAEALPTLAERRPDLLALQFGYRAQNAKLRAAILSRFPGLTFGVTGGSDNSDVRNIGPQVTLELPIFNHNQGNIAIETATRQQLHDEYAARLTAAVGQVHAMMADIDLLSQQLGSVRRDLIGTKRIATQAEAAFEAGNLDERSYVDLVTARLTREQEIVALEQALLDQQVAIATLIGAGMPAVTILAGDQVQ